MINLSLAGVVARRRLGFWSALQRQERLLTTSLTLCRSKKPFYNSSIEEELRVMKILVQKLLDTFFCEKNDANDESTSPLLSGEQESDVRRREGLHKVVEEEEYHSDLDLSSSDGHKLLSPNYGGDVSDDDLFCSPE